MSKMYLKGVSGIDKPVDFHGNEINVGDKLTFDYLDPFFADRGIDTTKYEGEPCFVVEEHKSGKGLCGKVLIAAFICMIFVFNTAKSSRGNFIENQQITKPTLARTRRNNRAPPEAEAPNNHTTLWLVVLRDTAKTLKRNGTS